MRNASFSFIEKNRPARLAEEFDEQVHALKARTTEAEAEMVRRADCGTLLDAPEELPINLREIVVLRELQELSYKEIAELVNMPIGTVMSSLSRARHRLSQSQIIFKNEKALAGSTRSSHGSFCG